MRSPIPKVKTKSVRKPGSGSTTALADPIWRGQAPTIRHLLQGPMLQPKLIIGAPDDAYEREADSIAERIIRIPDAGARTSSAPLMRQHLYSECQEELRLKSASDVSNPAIPVPPIVREVLRMPKPAVQRQIEPGEDTGDSMRRQAIANQLPAVDGPQGSVAAPPIVQEALNSPGHPLDHTIRAFMEARFGHDFSQVRIHRDKRADESAQAVNALAYTAGQDVVFAAGHYAPDQAWGRRLLAHELVHTLQQRHRRRVQRTGGEGDSRPAGAVGIYQAYGSDPLALGEELYRLTLESAENVGLVLEVLDLVSFPADVAYYFAEPRSEQDLRTLADSTDGVRLLNYLKDVMAFGEAGGTLIFERIEMSDKIDRALAMTGSIDRTAGTTAPALDCAPDQQRQVDDIRRVKSGEYLPGVVMYLYKIQSGDTFPRLAGRTLKDNTADLPGQLAEELVKLNSHIKKNKDPKTNKEYPALAIGDCVILLEGWVHPNVGSLPAAPDPASLPDNAKTVIAVIYAEQQKDTARAKEQQKYIWYSIRKRITSSRFPADLKSLFENAKQYQAIGTAQYVAAKEELDSGRLSTPGLINARDAVLDNWSTSLPSEAGKYYFHWWKEKDKKITEMESCYKQPSAQSPEEKEKQCAWEYAKKYLDVGSVSLAEGWHHRIRGDSVAPDERNGSMYIYPKLKTGEGGDRYEQEADRIADEVMRMPVPLIRGRTFNPQPGSARVDLLQRTAIPESVPASGFAETEAEEHIAERPSGTAEEREPEQPATNGESVLSLERLDRDDSSFITADTVIVQASLTGMPDAAALADRIEWFVYGIGPDSGSGHPSFVAGRAYIAFQPNPTRRPTGGSRQPNAAIAYAVEARVPDGPIKFFYLEQDLTDIVRQEYLDLGPTVPPYRWEIKPPAQPLFNTGNYDNLIVDRGLGDVFAQTIANLEQLTRQQAGANAPLPVVKVESGYRNPRRNVAAGSQYPVTSCHVWGSALDLSIAGANATLWERLREAGAMTGKRSICEEDFEPRPCNHLAVNHVHIEWC